ncbi:MAG: OB-fold domain-containing protein [candidate division NC10 bacterium]|nr:OB-fold domain-containing protein [candidate division NC10 bacterium]
MPIPSQETLPFWEGTKAGELFFQRCRACRRFRFYPRALCPYCLSGEADWVPSTGRGTVYSFTICHRPASEAFAAMVPYVVALIDMEEGVRLMSTIVGCELEAVRIGMPVEVLFEPVSDTITLYQFRPAN